MSPKIYFGHPVNTYNTSLEERLMASIQRNFPDHKIENPSEPHHQGGYQKWKQETGNGMNYYFEIVLPSCDTGGVFLPFRDGMWGAGIFSEAEFLTQRERHIWQINAGGFIIPVTQLGEYRKLSIEETRARIRNVGGMLIPY